MIPRRGGTIGSMNQRTMIGVLLAGLALVLASMPAAMAQNAASGIATAANAFIATLDDGERKQALFPFDDQQQRVRWSNLPVTIVQRGGVSLKDMTPVQRAAAMTMLASALSPEGMRKVQEIIEGDEVNQLTAPGGRQGGAMFGRDLYYFSILGTPSAKDPWMLQFGGHHLALNITIAGEQDILTPTLTGAQPAIYVVNGKTVRPLAGESDKAFALLSTLDARQKQHAILKYRVADLVLGPGQDGRTIQPEGLKASAMNERQRALLLDLIAEWAGIVHESAAAARMAEIKTGLADTWFAWSGPTTLAPGSNVTAYYRIQGPTLVIEYAPQQLGGNPALHIHTMYRDPTNDYGRKFTAK